MARFTDTYTRFGYRDGSRNVLFKSKYARWDSNPHTVKAQEPKSCVSASFTTGA